MSREVLLIQHAEAKLPTDSDGHFGPSLTEASIAEIEALEATPPYSRVADREVASSANTRATETGLLLGASCLHIYRSLEEIEPDMPIDEAKTMLAAGRAPDKFVAAGYFVLAGPPEEDIWIVHGWKAAGIIAADARRHGRNIEGTNLLLPPLGTMTLEI